MMRKKLNMIQNHQMSAVIMTTMEIICRVIITKMPGASVLQNILVTRQARPCRCIAVAVKQPEAFERGETIVDLSVRALDAVGEGGEEARKCQCGEEDERHGPRGRVARAVGGENRG